MTYIAQAGELKPGIGQRCRELTSGLDRDEGVMLVGHERAASRAGGSRVGNGAVRGWAKSAAPKVSERGGISADVLRQYEAAVT